MAPRWVGSTRTLRRLQPRFTGQGLACLAASGLSWPCARSFLRTFALTGDQETLLPQPDPLGHLSSWDRCNAGRRLRHCQTPPEDSLRTAASQCPGVTPSLCPAGERRLHDPTTQAPPPRRAGACGPRSDTPERASPRTSPPEDVPRLRMGTPARRIQAKGRITHPSAKRSRIRRTRGAFHRWDRPVTWRRPPPSQPSSTSGRPQGRSAGHRGRGQAPFGAPIRPTGGRDEPYLYPGTVLSTGCEQPVEDPRRLFQPHCYRNLWRGYEQGTGQRISHLQAALSRAWEQSSHV